jgi:3-hydroxyacyl-CoA dehydrogenase
MTIVPEAGAPKVVATTLRGRVAVLTIDNPPVNAASQAVRSQLAAALSQAMADPQVDAVVLACAGRTFVAGADIREFGKPPLAPVLTEVCSAIEAGPKPVVAALHGTALGGGLELALASHGRVATADARFGQPEVKLGIIPGAGGTQRLPRLVGVPLAVDLVSSGRMIGAADALAAGLVDRIAAGDLLSDSVALAAELAARPGPLPRTGERPVPAFDRETVETQIAAIGKRARGQASPSEAARAVLMAADVPLAEGLRRERETTLRLVTTDQAAALRNVFFAEREAAKVPGLEGVAARPVATVGVAGAGLMGSGIAVALADAGFAVVVVERDGAAAEQGRARVEATYRRQVSSGRIDAGTCEARLGRLSFAAERGAFAPCDLVIEAVYDDLAVKQELFAALSTIVRPDAILATNTSYLDPDAIASVVADPSRVLGLHFFSPANVMRLVEVVRAAATAPDVLATGIAVSRKLGKLPIVSGACEGFIGNRILSAYRREGDFMLEDGALPHEIDAALEAYGFPMGPYAVADMAGLDISWARRKRQAATRDPSERYVVIGDRLCEAGRLGRKTGKGYYLYEGEARRIDPEVTAIVEQASRDKGIERRSFTPGVIQARLVEAMAREGNALLAEGVALRPSDIDLVLINGYGYPAWRGGPMFEASRRNAAASA